MLYFVMFSDLSFLVFSKITKITFDEKKLTIDVVFLPYIYNIYIYVRVYILKIKYYISTSE